MKFSTLRQYKVFSNTEGSVKSPLIIFFISSVIVLILTIFLWQSNSIDGLWFFNSTPKKKLNLLFISLDTVRKDHLPIYGYDRDTTPALNRLSNNAIIFENAFAQDTNTNPSHSSMFTGVYPHIHGAQWNGRPFGSDQVTLTKILKDAGFHTGGFVSGYTLHRKVTGLHQGFDVYDDNFRTRRDGCESTQLAIDWLQEINSDDRFFLFLHFFDAHGPYMPKGKYATMFNSNGPSRMLNYFPTYQTLYNPNDQLEMNLNKYIDLYDGNIRHIDDCLARLLKEVNLKDTIVVAIADHGETLGERYWELDHGGQVFDEQIRIPLIISVPNLKPQRVTATVETIDLLPTLLELLNVDLPIDRFVQGVSLIPLLRGEMDDLRDISFSSARSTTNRFHDRKYRLDLDRRIHSVRSDRWKLVKYPGLENTKDYVELYDLKNDPDEKTNVAHQHLQIRDNYLNILHKWFNGADKGSKPKLDPEAQEKLKSLGYIQ